MQTPLKKPLFSMVLSRFLFINFTTEGFFRRIIFYTNKLDLKAERKNYVIFPFGVRFKIQKTTLLQTVHSLKLAPFPFPK